MRDARHREEMWKLMNGFRVSQCLHAAAELELADRLGDGAMARADRGCRMDA